MSNSKNGKEQKGKDLISIGIFSAIYFVINFAFVLMGGIHPVLVDADAGIYCRFCGDSLHADSDRGAETRSSASYGADYGTDLLCYRAVYPGAPDFYDINLYSGRDNPQHDEVR